MGILGGIDDRRRFWRLNQLANYAGLSPSSRESGAVQRRGGITRQGPSLMRYFTVPAAWPAMRSKSLTPALRKWVRGLIVKRGRQVAAVALAGRLLVLAHNLPIRPCASGRVLKGMGLTASHSIGGAFSREENRKHKVFLARFQKEDRLR
ncbi:MAG: transposase [Proteobacteria bacterium]|nr:transposase [Pseudomonadota bacterium]MBU2467234.1 transposase [Pseudomonadota bacterium]MBU2519100.1 transposase [Pseudomonadota bacterium]